MSCGIWALAGGACNCGGGEAVAAVPCAAAAAAAALFKTFAKVFCVEDNDCPPACGRPELVSCGDVDDPGLLELSPLLLLPALLLTHCEIAL